MTAAGLAKRLGLYFLSLSGLLTIFMVVLGVFFLDEPAMMVWLVIPAAIFGPMVWLGYASRNDPDGRNEDTELDRTSDPHLKQEIEENVARQSDE